jgi:hypothetical protein
MRLSARAMALARAELWEFELPASTDDRALVGWAAAANWFANPSRDHVGWRRHVAENDPLRSAAVTAAGGVGIDEVGAFRVVTWIDGERAPPHEDAVRRQLGIEVSVRRGHVWWLASRPGQAEECLRAASGGLGGGLLLNPHSQRARLYPAVLPVPALFTQSVDCEPLESAGGVA